jgi:hypothetical protein
MNLKSFLLLLCFILIFFASHAQNKYKEIDRKNILKINLLSPFLGTLSIQNERIINSESSIQLGFYYFSGVIFGHSIPVGAVCFTSEYRFYLVEEAPRGLYIQPYMRFGRYWEDKNYSNKVGSGFNAIAAGIVFGKQWIWADKFTFDMYVGPLYTFSFFDDPSFSTKDLYGPFKGYWFRSGITFGYYF